MFKLIFYFRDNKVLMSTDNLNSNISLIVIIKEYLFYNKKTKTKQNRKWELNAFQTYYSHLKGISSATNN